MGWLGDYGKTHAEDNSYMAPPVPARVLLELVERWRAASPADLTDEQNAVPTYAIGLLDAFHQAAEELATLIIRAR